VQNTQSTQIAEYRHLRGQARLRSLVSPDSFQSDPWHFRNRWHIWFDGKTVISTVFKNGTWLKGPEMAATDVQNPHVLNQLASQLKSSIGSRSPLAIIFHDAQEIALSSVKASYASSDQYTHAALVLLDNPARVIDEQPVPHSSYGLVHLQGSKRTVAVRLSSERFKAFESLAALNSEFRVGVFSAPIEFLANIPWFLEHQAVGASANGAAIIVSYEKFTFLALINAAGLQSIVALPKSERTPAATLERFQTEMKNCGMSHAVVSAFDYTGSPQVHQGYEEYFSESDTIRTFLIEDFKFFELDSSVDVFPQFTKAKDVEIRLEMLDASKHASKFFGGDSGAKRMIDAAHSNFNGATRSASATRLSYRENAAISLSRVLMVLISVPMLAAGVFAVINVVQTLNSPAWKLDKTVAQNAAIEAIRLRSIQEAVNSWDVILQPRSQAWAALEFASLLFPERTGVELDHVDYSCAPVTPGITSVDSGASQSIKLIRTWTLTGSAPSTATSYIESLNSDAATAALKKIADLLQKPSLIPAAGSVEVRPDRKPGDPGQGGDRIAFSVVVSQTLSDDLGLPISAPQLPEMASALKPASIPTAQ